MKTFVAFGLLLAGALAFGYQRVVVLESAYQED
jgi:hypothetical protein